MTQSCIATIVICTYNRAEWLAQCLSSLQPQLQGIGDVEVLVVDNNSTDHTADLVWRMAPDFPRLRYVREARQGLSHARNRGVKESAAEWLAFLDDDARVLPGYTDRLVALVEAGAFDVVAGVYLPWYSEGKKSWFRDVYASNQSLACCYGELPPDRFASGGIMLANKQLIESLGGFDPALGMAGAQAGYGEETRLQRQIRQAGGRIGVDPAWQIEHLTQKSKQRLRWLLSSAWQVGHDSWRTFGRTPSGWRMLLLLPGLITRPLRGIHRELFTTDERTTWQTLMVAAGQPLARTAGELVSGLHQMWRRS